MRLQCESSVQYLGSNFPASKSCASVLTLASGNAKVPILIISTTKNAKANKFQIRDNVLHIHRKFIQQGQATLQLKQPSLYVFIKKAQAVELGSFLRVLVALITGKELPVHLSQPPAKVKPPVTRLVVESVAELNATNGMFPRTLKHLTISNCPLSRPPKSLSGLKNLTSLTLTSSLLTSALDFAPLPLQSLDLSSNQLRELPQLPVSCPLVQSLTSLVLRSNQLRRIQLSGLFRLQVLDLSANPLPELPWSIGFNVAQLRSLDISETSITFLPSSTTLLPLQTFKYSWKSLVNGLGPPPAPTPGDPIFPPLVDLAAAAFLKTKMPYDASVIPFTLVWKLNDCRWCYCGQPSFSDTFQTRYHSLPVATVVYQSAKLPIGYGICPSCRNKLPKPSATS